MSTIYRIVPASIDGDLDTTGLSRASWAYLHGKLEEDAQYDIFYIKGENIKLTEGIHEAMYAGQKCTIYMWKHSYLNVIHGLAVYNNDIEAYEYAKECYNTKQEFI